MRCYEIYNIHEPVYTVMVRCYEIYNIHEPVYFTQLLFSISEKAVVRIWDSWNIEGRTRKRLCFYQQGWHGILYNFLKACLTPLSTIFQLYHGGLKAWYQYYIFKIKIK